MQGHNPNISQLGNYRLIQLLGKGGFATVYLGEHIHLQTSAAIKVLNEQHLSPVDQQGFIMEARTIRKLNHPHIVRVLDFGIEISKSGHDSSVPYLVMEYLPGGTLRKRHPHGTLVPLQQIAFYVSQVADALQYAHDQNIIHLDIKPENMLLDSPDTSNMQLADFGIAITGHDSKKRLVVEDGPPIQGTLPYIAPERFAGSPHRSSDQYSLGIVVYEWLTGTRPFEGTQQQIMFMHMNAAPPPLYGKYPHITTEIEAVVLKALEKAPGQRYPSVKEFAEALNNALMTAPPLDLPQPGQANPQDTKAEKSPPVALKVPASAQETILPSIHLSKLQSMPPQPANPTQQPTGQPSTSSPASSYQQPRPSPGRNTQQGPLYLRPDPNTPPTLDHNATTRGGVRYNAQTNPSSNPPVDGPFAEFIEMPRFVQDQLQILGQWIELDSEFARLPQNRFFRNVGMLLNFLSAFLVGLWPPHELSNGPSGWLIFYSLLFSVGLFALCIRAVKPLLSGFFGLSIALYWGFVGLIIGLDIQQYMSQLSSLFPPPLLAIILFGVSAYLHLRYVKTKLP